MSNVFEKIFNDIIKESNAPDVNRLINYLKAKLSNGKYANLNKYVKIKVGSTVDGSYVYIESTGKGLYSWYISDEKNDNEIIDQSDDYYDDLDDCLNDFRKLIH